MGRQPRQRPISCKLCRQRKLRCSRVFPCSNCLCRGVECEHDGPLTTSSHNSPEVSLKVKDVSNAELLARLEKLESIIALQNGAGQVERPVVPPERSVSSQLSSESSPISPQLQKITDDALFLERSCYGNIVGDNLVSDPLVFRICSMHKIANQPSYLPQGFSNSNFSGLTDVVKCIWIPLRQEARILVDKYRADVDHFHHIIHLPALYDMISTIYDKVEGGIMPDIGSMILLLCLAATATYSWSFEDDVRQLFTSAAEARSHSMMWIKASLDVIDYAARIAATSIEAIQGMVILFLAFCNLEGLSTRARGLLMKSIGMARDIGLHRLDSPSMLSERLKMGTIRAEIGRRTWWFLVATDWMMAHFAAPIESTYSVHPRQMAVRKPVNVDDDDLVDGKEAVGRPLHEPTRVSALIYRLRLAEICQSLMDRFPAHSTHPDRLDYNYVMEIDGKFRTFIRELPDFFQPNTPPKLVRESDETPIPSGILVQRYTLNLLMHRNLCKLHLPYFPRGSVEPAFAYSKDACLFSARLIIQAEKSLKVEGLPFATTRLRSIMIVRSVFLASIVFVLNACLNKEAADGDCDADYLLDSWRILNDVRDQSASAVKLLDLSMQVLRRHAPDHICLQRVSQMNFNSASTDSDNMNRTMPKAGANVPDLRPDTDSAYVEQQLQALEGRADLNAIDWDKLFYGLEGASFM